MSALYWFSRTDEAESEKNWKRLGHSNTVMRQMKMKTIDEAMLDMLKLLYGWGSVGFQVSGDGKKVDVFPCCSIALQRYSGMEEHFMRKIWISSVNAMCKMHDYGS